MVDLRKKLAGKQTKLARNSGASGEQSVLVGQYSEGNFLRIDIDLINPDPNQPRKFFNETALAELAQSIKNNGVLQPVLIRRAQDGQVWLVAGERRYRAAQKAGITVIPAIITTGDPAEIALVENIQRENLKPVEEAEALARLMKHHGYRQEDLAKVIGKARSTVAETLSLNRLPEEVKEDCRRADNFSRRLLVEVAKQKTPEKMVALLARVKEGNIDGTAIRKITRKKSNKIKKSNLVESVVKKSKIIATQLAKMNAEDLQDNEKESLELALAQLNEAFQVLWSAQEK